MERALQQAEACFEAGDHARAEALCREVLDRAPGTPDALRLMGVLRLEAGRAVDAIPLLEGALAAEPRRLDVLDALAAAYTAVGNHPLAEDMVRRGLALDAGRPVAHMRLGMALGAQGRWREAAAAFEQALERAPEFAEAHHNLGDALTKLHRPGEAIDSFRRALDLNPANADTHNSLGFAYQELRLWGAAARRFEQALAIDPDLATARYNRGVLALFLRDFETGWRGYERRLDRRVSDQFTLRRDRASLDRYERLPRWRGPTETGIGDVAIWAEQGIGDQILFSTLIPELIDSGASFLYEVDRRLLPAYQRAFPGVRFVALDDPPHESLERASRVLLAGSLPGLFRRTGASFDRQPARLLSASPERVAFYRRHFDAQGSSIKIALSWTSTRDDWWLRKKRAGLADFAPLLKVPGTQFVDVQYGDTAAERAATEAVTGAPLLHFGTVDYYNDLDELLAILEACDLVITTSNATAHLAGALGKRTWLLYLADQAPFHYWAHGGSQRALWYPAVEILTAARFLDWPSLVHFAASRLAAETTAREVAREHTAASAPDSEIRADDALARARRMREEGRLEEAVDVCRSMLAREHGDGRIWNELAFALRWQGKLDDARRAAVKATELEPGLAAAWFNLGAVQAAQGETAAGTRSYRQALALEPDFAECWSNLGDVLGVGGDREGEIQAYRRALDVKPQLAPVWSNLGGALLEAGQIGRALEACQRATVLDPEFAPGWNNLGNALHQCGEHDEALRACESALRIEPGFAEAWSGLGAALLSLGRHEEAIQAHHRAIDIRPGDAHHHFNLGVTLLHSGRKQEAIAIFRRVLALEPAHAQAHWNLSLALLGAGQFPAGWEEYDWRWRRRDADAKRYDFGPWDGDALERRRLLLWGEQGVGDEILYASMIPELTATRLSITLEVDGRLAPLFQRSFPAVSVVARRDPPAVDPMAFDSQAPLGSLGRWLRRSFESFPRHQGYLKPDPSRVRAYRGRLLDADGGCLVGISWRSANRELGAFKSHSLRDWCGLLRVPQMRFVNLQYGETSDERDGVARICGTRIECLPELDLYDDLDGLAALCAACDLVITASNVTAHLAGALGRPTWLLAPAANGRHWYWFQGRRDSPWYPTMRIFDQTRPGQWQETLDGVKQELTAFAASARHVVPE